MQLFLYGTLLDPALLARLAGRSVPVVPATLHGWRRVALGDGRYPTLRRARGVVEGAVAMVDRHALARLAAYEGPAYRLTAVRVRCGKGSVAARAWIAAGGSRRGWP